MKHYVIYHNADQRGDPFVPDDLDTFGIVTNSPVREIEDSTVWLIKGKGSPKNYSLCYRFIAEGVESGEEHGFKHRVYGSKGSWHTPAIELNSMAWFPDFRKAKETSPSDSHRSNSRRSFQGF